MEEEITTSIENAVSRFEQGFACSQAVLSVFAPQLGLSEENALKIASAFGGGMARQGEVCGAVTGALMTLGLKYGATTPDAKENVRQASKTVLQRFQKKNGSLLCRELLGYELNTPDGLENARNSGVFSSVCPLLVQYAAQLSAELIHQSD